MATRFGPTAKRQPVPDLSSIGRSGLKQYAGSVYDEWLPELRGPRGRQVIREMKDQDDVIGAGLLAIELLLRRVPWNVDPASEEDADVETAQFVESCLHDMSTSFEDTLSEIVTFLPFGWAWLETVYKRREGDKGDAGDTSRYSDGRIGWRKLAGRAQETLDHWEFDDGGGVRAMVQRDPSTGKTYTIPIEKSLLFRTTSHKGSPEGRSILRNAYRSYFLKKHITVIEGIGIERDLAGMPVAWMPAEYMGKDATDGQRALFEEVKKIVTNIRRDEQEGIVLPLAYDEKGNKMFELELLSTGGTRQFDTDKIINRYDSRIAMTMLADFILLGHEVHGSFALSDSKTNLFGFALGVFADVIEGVFNRHAIPRLLRLNGMPVDDRQPMLRHGDVETPDLEEIAAFITALGSAGAQLFPDARLEKHLLDLAQLPAPTESEVEERAATDEEYRRIEAAARLGVNAQGSALDQLKAPGTAPGGNDEAGPDEDEGEAA